MLFIIRQIIILVVVLAFFLSAILVIAPYFEGGGHGVVTFKPGVVSGDKITGEVTKKDRYVVIKPDGGGPEQDYTWEHVLSIVGSQPPYAKKINDVSDLLELITKLGVLAAALVFLIGLYQYQVGQTWKQEEFLAGTINDFGGRMSVENAKKMIELLMFYPQGRNIRLYPDAPDSGSQSIKADNILKALNPDKTDDLTDDEKQIRECFDAFFSRLERFEHYIESNLVSEGSVYIYLNYWINVLIGRATIRGKEPLLSKEYLEVLKRYIKYYEFPKVDALLDRYNDRRWRMRARRWLRYHLPR